MLPHTTPRPSRPTMTGPLLVVGLLAAGGLVAALASTLAGVALVLLAILGMAIGGVARENPPPQPPSTSWWMRTPASLENPSKLPSWLRAVLFL